MCDASLHHNTNPWHQKLKICHKEVQWLVPYGQIPLHNPEINYTARDITSEEIRGLVGMMLSQGVIRRLAPGEKALHSLFLLLRKSNGMIRETVDSRLLNSYCRPWTTAKTTIHRSWNPSPRVGSCLVY